MDLTVPKRTRPTKPRIGKKPSPIIGAKWIALTKGAFALVDEDDFESLSPYSWRLTHQGYASRDAKGQAVGMHRQIMREALSGDNPEVDHVDGNKLNNRRSNLRIATAQQNRQNRKKFKNNKSGHKGVIWRSGKWQAQAMVNRKLVVIGRYQDLLQAASAYEEYASKQYGEFFRSER